MTRYVQQRTKHFNTTGKENVVNEKENAVNEMVNLLCSVFC